MKTIALLTVLSLCGCGGDVLAQTDPVTQDIPVTSVGLDAYAEIALDMPSETQGTVQIQKVAIDTDVVNSSGATTMKLTVLLSAHGTAMPGAPVLFTAQNKPPEFATAVNILGPKSYAPASHTAEHVESTQLAAIVQQPRLWIIVGNTVTQAGIGDGLPLKLTLSNLILTAHVSKSFQGLGAAVDVSGL